MDASRKSSDGTAINIPESSRSTKAAPEAAQHGGGGGRKGLAIFDFILRLCAIAPALAASATMGTTSESLPFFTPLFQFQAQYNDIPTFIFFVIINAIVAGYLFLSLPFSIVCIVRPHALGLRLLLLILDTVMMALIAAAASAAAAIVYLAHAGNASANWAPICQQYNDFCKTLSGAVVGSFIAAVLLVFLVVLSAVALRKH